MSSSIGSAPSNGSNVTGYGHLEFSIEDSLVSVYIGKTPCQFTNENLVTENAYPLYKASSKTANLADIITDSRLAVLKVEGGIFQSFVISPKFKRKDNINNFIFFINNDKGQKGSVLLPNNIMKKLSDAQYEKLKARVLSL